MNESVNSFSEEQLLSWAGEIFDLAEVTEVMITRTDNEPVLILSEEKWKALVERLRY
jgi:hypothetical protein